MTNPGGAPIAGRRLVSEDVMEEEMPPQPTPDGLWIVKKDMLSPKLGVGMIPMYWCGPSDEGRRRGWHSNVDEGCQFATAEDAMAAFEAEYSEDERRRYANARPFCVGVPETLF